MGQTPQLEEACRLAHGPDLGIRDRRDVVAGIEGALVRLPVLLVVHAQTAGVLDGAVVALGGDRRAGPGVGHTGVGRRRQHGPEARRLIGGYVPATPGLDGRGVAVDAPGLDPEAVGGVLLATAFVRAVGLRRRVGRRALHVDRALLLHRVVVADLIVTAGTTVLDGTGSARERQGGPEGQNEREETGVHRAVLLNRVAIGFSRMVAGMAK